MELNNKKINFLGDSITQGVGTSSSEKIYLNLIKEQAKLQCARNYGISATRLAKQPGEDFSNAFVERYNQMDDDADIVVVFGGTNDYGHGMAQIGTFDDRTGDSFYGACHELMEGLINKYHDAEIVFMTPLHRENEFEPSSGCGLPLKTYVDIIKMVAMYYSIPVLDLYSNGGIQPCHSVSKQKLCPDGLHPNDEGHKKIASRLMNFLATL